MTDGLCHPDHTLMQPCTCVRVCIMCVHVFCMLCLLCVCVCVCVCFTRARDIKDVVIVRVEQICPFPYDLVGDIVKKYSNAEIYWVQEEPFNQGVRRERARRTDCQIGR